MGSDTEKQPKAKSKKRRRIVISETDTSDECDSPTVKTQRRQRISRIKNEIRILSKDKSRELQAGSSQNADITMVNCEKNSEPLNDQIPNSDVELVRSTLNSSVPETPKISKKIVNDGASTSSSRSDVNVGNNDYSKTPDQCPICWTPFTTQEIGIPICCEHLFCLQCLIEWSKNTNSCPIDRRIFSMIEVRDGPGGIVTRSIPVETRNNNGETENSQSERNSPLYGDLFTSTDEGTSPWPQRNDSQDETFFSSSSDVIYSENNDLGDDSSSSPPNEFQIIGDHSTDDDQARRFGSSSDNERNFSSSQENADRTFSSPQQEENNYSSSEEDEINYSSNDGNLTNDSSNPGDGASYSSDHVNEETNHGSDQEDEGTNDSFDQDDTGSNSSSDHYNETFSSPNVDRSSTPDRNDSSPNYDDNSSPDLRYSTSSSVSATSNISCSTSLTNSYSPPQGNYSPTNYSRSPSLDSDPSSSDTSYSS